MHLFETVAVRAGRPHFLQEHILMLEATASQARFHAPPGGLDALRKLDRSLPGALEIHENDALLRIFWTAGPGAPLDPPGIGKLFLMAEAAPLPATPPIIPLALDAGVLLPVGGGWKTGNYWANVLAARAARAAGAEDALVFDVEGCWLGGAFSNGFVRFGKEWVTPPAGAGVRAGVIRERVLGLLRVRERVVRREELARADAMFLTNSRLLAASVLRADSTQYAMDSEVSRLFEELLRGGNSPFANDGGVCVG
jgi:branched-subunit amino acid aminotransferase/4-amino-4-deoxychorismate lyase